MWKGWARSQVRNYIELSDGTLWIANVTQYMQKVAVEVEQVVDPDLVIDQLLAIIIIIATMIMQMPVFVLDTLMDVVLLHLPVVL